MSKLDLARPQPWHARWAPWQVVAAAFAAGAAFTGAVMALLR